MNKQEVIEKIKALKPDEQCLHEYQPEEWEAFQDGFDDCKCYVELIIEQLYEPVRAPEPKLLELEKPLVPKFVADWYENNKYNIENSIYRLCAGFYSKTLDKEIYDWFGDPEINSIETLVKMKLYGYEVENEQQYVVAIPDDERNQFIQLWKNRKGKLFFNFTDKIRYGKVHLLTEQEIKQKDERLWQFAKEVEE